MGGYLGFAQLQDTKRSLCTDVLCTRKRLSSIGSFPRLSLNLWWQRSRNISNRIEKLPDSQIPRDFWVESEGPQTPGCSCWKCPRSPFFVVRPSWKMSICNGLGHLMRDSARAARNHFISWINNSVGNRSKNLRWEIIAPVKRLRSTSSPEHLRWKFKMMQATCFFALAVTWTYLNYTAKTVREYPLDSLYPQLLWTLKPPQVKIGHSLPLAEKMWSLFFPFRPTKTTTVEAVCVRVWGLEN